MEQAAAVANRKNDFKIDLDRGVTYRRHPKGINIYMYKDEPGKYYDASGGIVAESFAKKAGFDVGKLKLKGDVQARINALSGQLQKEYKDLDKREIIYANKGYKVLAATDKLADIVDDTGRTMNVTPMLTEEAVTMLKEMMEDSKHADET